MKNIIENNKLIAEFMGLFDKILSTGNIHSWSDATFYYCTEDSKEKVIEGIIKYSKYHTDWNWLMKVVEKIHSMQSYGVLINPNGTYIQDEDDKVICMTFKNEEVNGEIISSSNIEATFNCCVEFVKWYNEQNK